MLNGASHHLDQPPDIAGQIAAEARPAVVHSLAAELVQLAVLRMA
jgi:hypothetical protein